MAKAPEYVVTATVEKADERRRRELGEDFRWTLLLSVVLGIAADVTDSDVFAALYHLCSFAFGITALVFLWLSVRSRR